MTKISRQVREIINIVLFFIIVGLVVTAYIIYPLNRTKNTMGRADIDEFNVDSLPSNDPAPFVEAGLVTDTFSLEIDINTTLACLYIEPTDSTMENPRGTVFLLNDQRRDRNSLLPLTKKFVDSGFVVVVYDQRASGLSSGKYHGEGFYEANDLEEIIPYLVLRERLYPPVAVVGFALGADAGLLAALDEERINMVVAANPYLTTMRYQNMLKEEHGTLWFPFYRTVMWWWYNMRSGYAAPYRKIDDIEPVACRTLILSEPGEINDPEFVRVKEISSPERLELKPMPENEEMTYDEIISFIIQP